MFGATQSLILLTSSQLARIDFASHRGRLRVEQIQSCPALASGSLSASIAIASQLGQTSTTAPRTPTRHAWRLPRVTKSKHHVWILSADFWNDTISLPLEVTVLLQPDEIEQALALEAEHYSGISGLNSRIHSKQLVDTSTNSAESQQWWVTQVANQEIDTLQKTVSMLGGTLIGVAHTKTVPLTDPEQHLQELAEHWAQRVTSTDIRQSLILPAQAPTANHSTIALQVGTALVSGLVCLGLYQSKAHRLHILEQQCQTLTKTLNDQQEIDKELRAVEGRLTTLRQELSNAQSKRLVNHAPLPPTKPASLIDNAAWLAFLSALESASPEECWIERWEMHAAGIQLSGRALTVDRVHELTTRLESLLTDSGWTVTPPTTQLREDELTGFSIDLSYRGKNAAAKPDLAYLPARLGSPLHGGQP